MINRINRSIAGGITVFTKGYLYSNTNTNVMLLVTENEIKEIIDQQLRNL